LPGAGPSRGEEQEGAKSSRDERIPLTQPVRDLLAEIGSNDSAYVFPGRDGVSHMTDINKQVNAIKKQPIFRRISVLCTGCGTPLPAWLFPMACRSPMCRSF